MFRKLLVYSKSFLFFILMAVIMILSLRGNPGHPTSAQLNSNNWIENGPFELSPERGRYALLYALIEDRSFQLSIPLARFSTPDVGYIDGQYVSLFAPGVSLLLVPSYLLGKLLNTTQVVTFGTIALFAIANVYLIRKIARFIGVSELAATISGLLFLFATPAFAYGVTLYQHHISTLIILSGIWLVIRYNTIFSLMAIWLLAAASVVIDNPNFFMMLPIAFSALGKFFIISKSKTHLRLQFLYPRLVSFIFLLLPVAILLWFNQMSYKNPLQLSGGIASVQIIDRNGHPVTQKDSKDATTTVTQEDLSKTQNVFGFFRTRNIVNGLYVEFFSLDRGVLIYTPVMLFGFLGMYLAIKNKLKYSALLIITSGINILLYAMWGDPQGGWAFGSRYLIPTYAIMAILIAYLLHEWRGKIFFLMVFFVVLCYSVSISTLGALTTNANPPKNEALYLEKTYHVPQPYTYQRNIDLLNKNVSKSFFYQTYARPHLTAWQYYSLIVGALLLMFMLLLSFLSSKASIVSNSSFRLNSDRTQYIGRISDSESQ